MDEDFTLWENLYGRKLSAADRLEIKSNVLDLLRVVGELRDAKPEYFRGLLDGLRQERVESAKRL